MRSHALWLAGATAVTIAATATAAAAGSVGAPRLAAMPGPAAPGVAAAPGASLTAATPDFGRRRGNPGAARTPAAKVSLTEADSGKTITVTPGTEIDVALKPDSGQRWAPPRSDNQRAVSRGGRMGGWHRPGGPGGRQQDSPDLGPGRGGRGDGSTHAVFFAHGDGNATLSSAEHKGGLMLLQRGSGPTRSWSVKVTVSGPAPAAPKPQPKPQPQPGPPGAGIPGTPGLPGVQQAPAAATRLVAPVTATVQRLGVALPRL
jgi:hypothetical protein